MGMKLRQISQVAQVGASRRNRVIPKQISGTTHKPLISQAILTHWTLLTKLVTLFVFFCPKRWQVYLEGVVVRYLETRLLPVVVRWCTLLLITYTLLLVMCDNFTDTYSLVHYAVCCYELTRVVACYTVLVLHVSAFWCIYASPVPCKNSDTVCFRLLLCISHAKMWRVNHTHLCGCAYLRHVLPRYVGMTLAYEASSRNRKKWHKACKGWLSKRAYDMVRVVETGKKSFCSPLQ